MNDEIKEILEELKDSVNEPILEDVDPFAEETYEYPNHFVLDPTTKDCKLLLDYITNLQAENEKLQEQFKDWKREIEKEKKHYLCDRTDCCGRIKNSKKYSSVYHELKDYKSRIDKATEYVNTHKPSDTISFPLMKKDEENQVKSCFDYEFREIYQKELLDILQGSDKE